MNQTISWVCEDCGTSDVTFVPQVHFQVAHEPGCPVMINGKLGYLATQNLYEAALLVEGARGMVSDYGSSPVVHVVKNAA